MVFGLSTGWSGVIFVDAGLRLYLASPRARLKRTLARFPSPRISRSYAQWRVAQAAGKAFAKRERKRGEARPNGGARSAIVIKLQRCATRCGCRCVANRHAPHGKGDPIMLAGRSWALALAGLGPRRIAAVIRAPLPEQRCGGRPRELLASHKRRQDLDGHDHQPGRHRVVVIHALG